MGAVEEGPRGRAGPRITAFSAFSAACCAANAAHSKGPAAAATVRRAEPWTVAAACLVPLFSSPIAWTHYFVLAVPMLLVLLAPATEGRQKIVPRLVAAFTVAALFALAMFPVKALLGVRERMDVALWVNAALLVLIALALLRSPAAKRVDES